MSYSLAVAVVKAGNITVQVNKTGIENGSKTVAVSKSSAGGANSSTLYTASANNTSQTTAINFTFSASVTGLSASDITVANETGFAFKGALSGGGTSWSLAVTTARTGNVKVSIDKTGIQSGFQTVAVYRPSSVVVDNDEGPILYDAVANNTAASNTDTTSINFTFSASVSGLTANDINVENYLTGYVTKGALSGIGTSWSLAVTTANAGKIFVTIDKSGIQYVQKTVTVYKKSSAITYTVTPNNTDHTTAINFTFSAPVSGLTANDINVENYFTGSVTKGALSGGGTSWSLAVTVATAGTVSVSINKTGIQSSPKMVAVFKNTDWTAVANSTFRNAFADIAYGNNRFVAVGGDQIAYSTDGITWTKVTNSTFTGTTPTCIAYGNNRFVAGGGVGKMAYSSDGVTWTAVTNSTFGTTKLNAIAYGNNRFVAVADGGKMAYSPDGVTWTAVADGPFGTGSDNDVSKSIRQIAWGNNRFVVGCYSKMAHSPDGVTWTAVADSPFGTTGIDAIAYGNNRFVAVGPYSKMAHSTNGITWTAGTISFDIRILAIAYGNNKFVAVGQIGKMAYSADGITWTEVTNSTFGDTNITAIAYGNDKWVAAGLSGKIAYKFD